MIYIYKMINFCYDEIEKAVEKERNRNDAGFSDGNISDCL